MRGLDTNVLVRFLTRDDAAQSALAERLVDELVAAHEEAHLDVVVLCELVWVLQSGYGFGRQEIADTLEALLGASQFVIDDRDLIRESLTSFRSGRGDFSDHLIGLRNRRAGCRDTVTFDRKLQGSEAFSQL